MSENIQLPDDYQIQNSIHTIRGMQVMIDRDLADLYGVETKVFNQAVKRNIKRFPISFRFQLTEQEFINLRSQFVTSSFNHGGRRYLPFVFTEQGVAMLSAVLKSSTAIKISVQIIESFVEMRKLISNNSQILQRLDNIETKQIENKIENNKKFNQLFDALEINSLKPRQGIFFDGQTFDAYLFVAGLIKRANKSIVLIDNFIDESVLTLFSKRRKRCKVIIYTEKISEALKLDLIKHNKQYPPIEIKIFTKSHDRFLILDEEEIYHFGASLKDLGRRWFAFSKMDKSAFEMLDRLKEAKDIK